VRLAYLSSCGTTANKSIKLSNTALSTPSISSTASITQTLVSNSCGARVYRYTAPALISATSTSPATTGYAWTLPVGPVGSTGTLDSGSLSGRVIKVLYTSNAASGIGDSIKVAYVSGCGTGVARSVKLTIAAKTGCPSAPKANMKIVIVTPSVGMQVSPNPTSDKFRLMVTGASFDTKTTAVIMDMQGRIVKRYSFNSNTSLDFGNDLMPGTYMIKIAAGKEVRVIKVVKQ